MMNSTDTSPRDALEEIRQLLTTLPGPDREAAARVATREARLTKPPGALGRLEEISGWLASWQRQAPPRLERVAARIFAGTHGVAERGVSAYPAAVTAQMVANFASGGAAINQLCRAYAIELQVTALDLEHPTTDFTTGPAMSEVEFVAAFTTGLHTADDRPDLLCLGEMGIGNTTSAAAVAMALFGGQATAWTGAGTGVAGEQLERKRRVVDAAAHRHQAEAVDGLDLLRRLGGRELVAIAGAVTGARLRGVPVILDGFISTAAAAPLAMVRADALDHCRVGHVSVEPGHRLLLRRLGLDPLLGLDMRLGEGSGAAVAVALCRGAVACHTGMATFEQAGVSDRSG